MVAKKPPKRPTRRTSLPYYVFGSAKAAMTNPCTKKRVPAKLPTSLDELQALKKGSR